MSLLFPDDQPLRCLPMKGKTCLLRPRHLFVPEASYEGISEMPSILGWHGCLDRLRFGVDPVTDTFYFGPAS